MGNPQLLSFLKTEAKKIDDVMRHDLLAIQDPLLSEVIEYAIFNGGKRVRPILCVLAAKFCGHQDDDIYRMAIAFEYLHAATLLHDDVIDRTDMRRGEKTANKIWGNTPAILTGDYLHARSMFLIGDLGGTQCLEIICRATAAMVEGEFLQLRNARNFNQSEDDYFTVIMGKTALLIGAVCELGAVFANADKKQREALREYGTSLGSAFQIVDDLLDYLGDTRKTGKVVGNDFIEGKMTLPLIQALRKANQPDREFLLDLLTGKEKERKLHIDSVRSLIEKYHGFQFAAQKAEHLTHSAITNLDCFLSAPDQDIKSLLVGLAKYVLTREK